MVHVYATMDEVVGVMMTESYYPQIHLSWGYNVKISVADLAFNVIAHSQLPTNSYEICIPAPVHTI